MTEERKAANSNLNKAETSILKSPLIQNGFIKRTYGSYYRVVEGDLLQSIGIQKHSWQTTFTVNISISQLYQGQLSDHLSAVILVRQGSLYPDTYRQENKIDRLDHWFDFENVDTTARSMETLKTELDKFIFPFLDSVNTNRKLADFVFERTLNHTPYFIQPDTTWSNYLASMLALRLEDKDNSKYFLNKTITNAKEIEYAWGQKLHSEANSLKEMFEKDKTLIQEYFQKNTTNNIERCKLKLT